MRMYHTTKECPATCSQLKCWGVLEHNSREMLGWPSCAWLCSSPLLSFKEKGNFKGVPCVWQDQLIMYRSSPTAALGSCVMQSWCTVIFASSACISHDVAHPSPLLHLHFTSLFCSLCWFPEHVLIDPASSFSSVSWLLFIYSSCTNINKQLKTGTTPGQSSANAFIFKGFSYLDHELQVMPTLRCLWHQGTYTCLLDRILGFSPQVQRQGCYL